MLIDIAYKGRLLSEIISMPKKAPITFEHAVNLCQTEFDRLADAGQSGPNRGQAHWHYRNFVLWISEQGYSIELTGDEFETPTLSRLVA